MILKDLILSDVETDLAIAAYAVDMNSEEEILEFFWLYNMKYAFNENKSSHFLPDGWATTYCDLWKPYDDFTYDLCQEIAKYGT